MSENKRSKLSKSHELSLYYKVQRLVQNANESVLPERQVSFGAALEVADREVRRNKNASADALVYSALRAVSAFISLANKNKVTTASLQNADLLSIGHPMSTKLHSMDEAAVRHARAQWIAADSHIADDAVRSLVASAHSLEPGSIERRHAFARLAAMGPGLVPITAAIDLEPIIAVLGLGLGGNSRAARSLRARMQRRDRRGRFAFMGGSWNFSVRFPDGKHRSVTGRVVGASGADDVEVEVLGSKYVPNGVYAVPASRGISAKAIIPKTALKGLPEKDIEVDAESRKYSLDSSSLRRMDAPSDWKKIDSGDPKVASYTSADGYRLDAPLNDKGEVDFSGINSGTLRRAVGGAPVTNAPIRSWSQAVKSALSDQDNYDAYLKTADGQKQLSKGGWGVDVIQEDIGEPKFKSAFDAAKDRGDRPGPVPPAVQRLVDEANKREADEKTPAASGPGKPPTTPPGKELAPAGEPEEPGREKGGQLATTKSVRLNWQTEDGPVDQAGLDAWTDEFAPGVTAKLMDDGSVKLSGTEDNLRNALDKATDGDYNATDYIMDSAQIEKQGQATAPVTVQTQSGKKAIGAPTKELEAPIAEKAEQKSVSSPIEQLKDLDEKIAKNRSALEGPDSDNGQLHRRAQSNIERLSEARDKVLESFFPPVGENEPQLPKQRPIVSNNPELQDKFDSWYSTKNGKLTPAGESENRRREQAIAQREFLDKRGPKKQGPELSEKRQKMYEAVRGFTERIPGGGSDVQYEMKGNGETIYVDADDVYDAKKDGFKVTGQGRGQAWVTIPRYAIPSGETVDFTDDEPGKSTSNWLNRAADRGDVLRFVYKGKTRELQPARTYYNPKTRRFNVLGFDHTIGEERTYHVSEILPYVPKEPPARIVEPEGIAKKMSDISGTTPDEIANEIQQAIDTQSPVRFDYSGKTREFLPERMYTNPKSGKRNAVGFSRTDGEDRTFTIDKMSAPSAPKQDDTKKLGDSIERMRKFEADRRRKQGLPPIEFRRGPVSDDEGYGPRESRVPGGFNPNLPGNWDVELDENGNPKLDEDGKFIRKKPKAWSGPYMREYERDEYGDLITDEDGKLIPVRREEGVEYAGTDRLKQKTQFKEPPQVTPEVQKLIDQANDLREVPTDALLPELYKAIEAQQDVAFDFNDKPRVVTPAEIVENKAGKKQLKGFSKTDGEDRTFTVDKMNKPAPDANVKADDIVNMPQDELDRLVDAAWPGNIPFEAPAPRGDFKQIKTPASSSVDEISYDPNTGELLVKFKSREGKGGGTYLYPDVKPQDVDAIEKADSIGSAVGKFVKGRAFEKLTGDQAASWLASKISRPIMPTIDGNPIEDYLGEEPRTMRFLPINRPEVTDTTPAFERRLDEFYGPDGKLNDAGIEYNRVRTDLVQTLLGEALMLKSVEGMLEDLESLGARAFETRRFTLLAESLFPEFLDDDNELEEDVPEIKQALEHNRKTLTRIQSDYFKAVDSENDDDVENLTQALDNFRLNLQQVQDAFDYAPDDEEYDTIAEETAGTFDEQAFDTMFDAPEGAYKPNIFAPYRPKGKTFQTSANYTDDPELLSNMFSDVEMSLAIKNGIEDGTGEGPLEFDSGIEFVPVEALLEAVENMGVDKDVLLAGLYLAIAKSGDDSNAAERAKNALNNITQGATGRDARGELRNRLSVTAAEILNGKLGAPEAAKTAVELITAHDEVNPRFRKLASDIEKFPEPLSTSGDIFAPGDISLNNADHYKQIAKQFAMYYGMLQSGEKNDEDMFKAYWAMLMLSGGPDLNPKNWTLDDEDANPWHHVAVLLGDRVREDKTSGGAAIDGLIKKYGDYRELVAGRSTISQGLEDLSSDGITAAMYRFLADAAMPNSKELFRVVTVDSRDAALMRQVEVGSEVLFDGRSFTENTEAFMNITPAQMQVMITFRVQPGDINTVDIHKISWIPGEREHIGFGAFTVASVNEIDDQHYTVDLVPKSAAPEAPEEAPRAAEAPSAGAATTVPYYGDVSGWKRVGAQAGSNAGGVFEDENGNRYYVKKSRSRSHAENEALASAFYRFFGIPSSEVGLGSAEPDAIPSTGVYDANNPEFGADRIITPMIPGAEETLENYVDDQNVVSQLFDGFAIDAWLSNYDVIGMVYDNVVVDDNNNAYRIDPGGALKWRAQGKPKDWFGPEVGELDSMRDNDINPTAGSIFGRMKLDQIIESSRKLLNITPSQIDDIVDSVISDLSDREMLKDILKRRRSSILDAFAIKDTTVDPFAERVPLTESIGYEAQDLQPGDVIGDDSFVIERIFRDGDTPKGKVSVQGYFPGHESQRKEWNEATIIPAARGGTIPPKGDKPALHRPKPPRKPSPGAFNGAMAERLKDATTWEEAAQIIRSTPIVYFDYETTGLPGPEKGGLNRPVQIGAVVVKDGKVVDRFSTYMNPEHELSDWSASNLKQMDGSPVTDEWLKTQPSMKDAHEQFIDFVRRSVGDEVILGGQYTPFDLEVLGRVLREQGLSLDIAGTIDSKDLAEGTLPKWNSKTKIGASQVSPKDGKRRASNSLGPVAEFLQVQLPDWHRADADAEASWEITDAMLDRAIENPDTTPTTLLNVDGAYAAKQKQLADYENEYAQYEAALAEYVAAKAIAAAWNCGGAGLTAAVGPAEGPCSVPDIEKMVREATPLPIGEIDPEGVEGGSTSKPTSMADAQEIDDPKYDGIDTNDPYKDEPFMPTEEQRAILDSVMEGNTVVVEALAGTGKTSTLLLAGKRKKKERPAERGVYIAFNKSAQLEAERKFADAGLTNIEVITNDAISYRWAPSDIKEKMSRLAKTNPLAYYKNFANAFGITEFEGPGGETVGLFEATKFFKSVVNKYMISADDEIGPQHFAAAGWDGNVPDWMMAIANNIWNDYTDPNGNAKINNTVITKMWALSKPDLSQVGSGTKFANDFIFFDEAQDINPVSGKVIGDQTNQVVYVGDENQAIYAFRGGENQLAKVDKVVQRLPLTKSFRFGVNIEKEANKWLKLLGSDLRVIGAGADPGELVGQGALEDTADAILVRTNSGGFGAIADQLARGRTVGVTKNYKADLISLTDTAEYLITGNNKPRQLHEDLAPFKSWKEVEKAIEDELIDSKKLEIFAELVESQGIPGIREMIDQLKLVKGSGEIRDMSEDATQANIGDVSPGSSGELGKGVKYAVSGAFVSLTGNTYANKDAIKSTKKFKYNGTTKTWDAPRSSDEETFEILNQLSSALGLKPVEGPEDDGTIDVMVTTVHQAKGLEWDKVMIWGDFWGPRVNKATGELMMPEPTEYKIAYVAVTRAKKKLDVGPLEWINGFVAPDAPVEEQPEAEAPAPTTEGEGGGGTDVPEAPTPTPAEDDDGGAMEEYDQAIQAVAFALEQAESALDDWAEENNKNKRVAAIRERIADATDAYVAGRYVDAEELFTNASELFEGMPFEEMQSLLLTAAKASDDARILKTAPAPAKAPEPAAAPEAPEPVKTLDPEWRPSDVAEPSGSMPTGVSEAPDDVLPDADAPKTAQQEALEKNTSFRSDANKKADLDRAFTDFDDAVEMVTGDESSLKTSDRKRVRAAAEEISDIRKALASGKISEEQATSLIAAVADKFPHLPDDSATSVDINFFRDMIDGISDVLTGKFYWRPTGSELPPLDAVDESGRPVGYSRNGKFINIGARVRDKWGFSGTVEGYNKKDWIGVYVRFDIDPRDPDKVKKGLWGPGIARVLRNPSVLTVLGEEDDNDPWIDAPSIPESKKPRADLVEKQKKDWAKLKAVRDYEAAARAAELRGEEAPPMPAGLALMKPSADLVRESKKSKANISSYFDDANDDVDIADSTNDFSLSKDKKIVASDAVIIANDSNGTPMVLMITRGFGPFKKAHALPGGFRDAGESFEAAADREMMEEVGISPDQAISRRYLGEVDSNDWDPRAYKGAYVGAVAYEVPMDTPLAAGDDATGAAWVSIPDIIKGTTPIAFGHATWLAEAFKGTKYEEPLRALVRASKERNARLINQINAIRAEKGFPTFDVPSLEVWTPVYPGGDGEPEDNLPKADAPTGASEATTTSPNFDSIEEAYKEAGFTREETRLNSEGLIDYITFGTQDINGLLDAKSEGDADWEPDYYDRDAIQEYVDSIDAIIDDAPVFDTPVTVYRGTVSNKDRLPEVGSTISSVRYMSTSLSPEVAKDFTDLERHFSQRDIDTRAAENVVPVIYAIQVPAGAKFLSIPHFLPGIDAELKEDNQFADVNWKVEGKEGQQEILLPRETTLEVSKVETTADGTVLITAALVNQNQPTKKAKKQKFLYQVIKASDGIYFAKDISAFDVQRMRNGQLTPPNLPFFAPLFGGNDQETGEGYYFASDGKRYWGRFGAAGALVRRKNASGAYEYLLARRSSSLSSGGGMWAFPGGAHKNREMAETPGATAKEEFMEEVGGDISKLDPVYTHVANPSPDWSYETIVFEVGPGELNNLSPKDGENSEVGWFTADQIVELGNSGKLMGAFSDASKEIFSQIEGEQAGIKRAADVGDEVANPSSEQNALANRVPPKEILVELIKSGSTDKDVRLNESWANYMAQYQGDGKGAEKFVELTNLLAELGTELFTMRSGKNMKRLLDMKLVRLVNKEEKDPVERYEADTTLATLIHGILSFTSGTYSTSVDPKRIEEQIQRMNLEDKTIERVETINSYPSVTTKVPSHANFAEFWENFAMILENPKLLDTDPEIATKPAGVLMRALRDAEDLDGNYTRVLSFKQPIEDPSHPLNYLLEDDAYITIRPSSWSFDPNPDDASESYETLIDEREQFSYGFFGKEADNKGDVMITIENPKGINARPIENEYSESEVILSNGRYRVSKIEKKKIKETGVEYTHIRLVKDTPKPDKQSPAVYNQVSSITNITEELMNDIPGISVEPQELTVHTEYGRATSYMVKYAGRPIVAININGVRVPFYMSTGLGGKTDVEANKWYPIFGISEKTGWFNKGLSAEDMNTYHGSPELRAVAEWLNEQFPNAIDMTVNVPVFDDRNAVQYFLSQVNASMPEPVDGPTNYGAMQFAKRHQQNINNVVERIRTVSSLPDEEGKFSLDDEDSWPFEARLPENIQYPEQVMGMLNSAFLIMLNAIEQNAKQPDEEELTRAGQLFALAQLATQEAVAMHRAGQGKYNITAQRLQELTDMKNEFDIDSIAAYQPTPRLQLKQVLDAYLFRLHKVVLNDISDVPEGLLKFAKDIPRWKRIAHDSVVTDSSPSQNFLRGYRQAKELQFKKLGVTGAGRPAVIKSIDDFPLTSSAFDGIPSLAEAIKTVVDKEEDDGVLGASALIDSADIEDLDVHVATILTLPDGERKLRLRYKLTPWAMLELENRVQDIVRRKEDSEEKWSIGSAVLANTRLSDTGNVLVYESESQFYNGKRYLFLGEDNSINADISITSAQEQEGTMYVQKAQSGEVPASFHGEVVIDLPLDASLDDIAKAMKISGVSDVRGASKDDTRILFENKLLSLFERQNDPISNVDKPEIRDSLLTAIKNKWDVTPDDITMAVGNHGRINYLFPTRVAEDIKRVAGTDSFEHWMNISAIVAAVRREFLDNDKTFPLTTFEGIPPKPIIDEVAKAVVSMLTRGLLSTVTRFNVGLPYKGQSESEDMGTGGADYVFLTPKDYEVKNSIQSMMSGWKDSVVFMLPAETIYSRTDFFANVGDSYGERRVGSDSINNSAPGAYETMVKHGQAVVTEGSLALIPAAYYYRVMEMLDDMGITEINGIPVKDVVVNSNEESEKLNLPGTKTYGKEIERAIGLYPGGDVNAVTFGEIRAMLLLSGSPIVYAAFPPESKVVALGYDIGGTIDSSGNRTPTDLSAPRIYVIHPNGHLYSLEPSAEQTATRLTAPFTRIDSEDEVREFIEVFARMKESTKDLPFSGKHFVQSLAESPNAYAKTVLFPAGQGGTSGISKKSKIQETPESYTAYIEKMIKAAEAQTTKKEKIGQFSSLYSSLLALFVSSTIKDMKDSNGRSVRSIISDALLKIRNTIAEIDPDTQMVLESPILSAANKQDDSPKLGRVDYDEFMAFRNLISLDDMDIAVMEDVDGDYAGRVRSVYYVGINPEVDSDLNIKKTYISVETNRQGRGQYLLDAGTSLVFDPETNEMAFSSNGTRYMIRARRASDKKQVQKRA